MFAFQRLPLPAIQRAGERGARLQALGNLAPSRRRAGTVGSIECLLLLLLKFLANFCFYQKKSLPGLERKQDSPAPPGRKLKLMLLIGLSRASLIRDRNGQHLSSATTGTQGTMESSLLPPPHRREQLSEPAGFNYASNSLHHPQPRLRVPILLPGLQAQLLSCFFFI